jgi:predicted DNA-binding transcriptional regulator YafY
VLKDRDWLTIIGSLLHDKTPEARQLAKMMLTKTKHGRQVRMLRLINERSPSIVQMQKVTNMSRRTIFRYLNSLEEYGVRLDLDDQFRYNLVHMPAALRRVL